MILNKINKDIAISLTQISIQKEKKRSKHLKLENYDKRKCKTTKITRDSTKSFIITSGPRRTS